MATEKDADKSRKEKLLQTAKERFRLAIEAEDDIRRDAREDDAFAAGEQWPDDIKQARAIEKRPCLTINRLPQAIHQITNDQRQNRPAIKVSPVDDTADIETAKVLQGLVRHIEYSSDADTTYDTAFDHAVRGGFGYFRIVTEYCDPMSFEQDIRFKRIPNRFMVALDPSYQQPDGSDTSFGFVFEDVPEDLFKVQYPDAELSQMADWDAIGNERDDWIKTGTARVAEYYYKEFEEKTLCQLTDGSVVEKSQLPEGFPQEAIVSERKSLIPKVKWCKFNGVEILEETDWLGKWIPIIPVLGQEINLEGKRHFESLVRHAKDPQRMYNFFTSAETEAIALAPRTPFVGAEGQFEGYEKQWRTANTQNHAFLQYKPVDLNGTPLPPPQRNHATVDTGAISNARMLASEDVKATTGLYDAAMGARSNESSGVGIQRRVAQAQTSNYHFIDNLSKSIRHAGRILVDLIPKVYDTARAVRILGEDGTEEVVKVNQQIEQQGQARTYDLGSGKYDVTVSTGPTFETKRQEAVQAMIDFTKAMPNQAAVISDLLVKNMDFPGSQDMAERLRKTLPPGMAEDKDKKPIPPEVQNQLGQMNQIIEQLTEQLNHKSQQIEQKTIELESKERIEMAKLRMQAEIKLAEIGSQEGMALLAHEVAGIGRRLDMLGINEPIEMENEGASIGQAPQMDQPAGEMSPGGGEFT